MATAMNASSQMNPGTSSQALPRRTKNCRRCSNHGIIVPLKGHKGKCPNAACSCHQCALLKMVANQRLQAKQNPPLALMEESNVQLSELPAGLAHMSSTTSQKTKLKSITEAIVSMVEMCLEDSTMHQENRELIQRLVNDIKNKSDNLCRMCSPDKTWDDLITVANDCLDRVQGESSKYHVTYLRTFQKQMEMFEQELKTNMNQQSEGLLGLRSLSYSSSNEDESDDANEPSSDVEISNHPPYQETYDHPQQGSLVRRPTSYSPAGPNVSQFRPQVVPEATNRGLSSDQNRGLSWGSNNPPPEHRQSPSKKMRTEVSSPEAASACKNKTNTVFKITCYTCRESYISESSQQLGVVSDNVKQIHIKRLHAFPKPKANFSVRIIDVEKNKEKRRELKRGLVAKMFPRMIPSHWMEACNTDRK